MSDFNPEERDSNIDYVPLANDFGIKVPGINYAAGTGKVDNVEELKERINRAAAHRQGLEGLTPVEKIDLLEILIERNHTKDDYFAFILEQASSFVENLYSVAEIRELFKFEFDFKTRYDAAMKKLEWEDEI